PFYMFYSMFGFQRTGDQIWAASDARSRGFLIGGTAGRTTLMGEGLQHNDGHSLLLASTVPSVRAYDPAFAYEMAILVEHGINEMYGVPQKDEIYYITLYNENYQMPAMPEGVDFEEVKAGIINGIYLFRQAPSIENENGNLRATILFSGTAWLAAVEAQKILAERYSVAADLYSVTSYKSLREDALETERYNRLHPLSAPRQSTISSVLDASSGPILAVSDFMKAVPDQVGRFLANRNFTPLGTDG
ncbi:2-oxo-acid dehydrogenase E1 subunit, homodimeric type, partial [mine drainage metagenome]